MSRRLLLALAMAGVIVAAVWMSRSSVPQPDVPARTNAAATEVGASRLPEASVLSSSEIDPSTEPARKSSLPTDSAPEEAGATVPPAQYGTLVGHLYDSRYRTLGKHKLSIANRKTGADAKSFFAYTHRDGSFRFKQPIPVGDWWLYYEGDGQFATAAARPIREQPVRIVANETTSEEIVLVHDRCIYGTLVFKDEFPPLWVDVTLASDLDPSRPIATVDLWNDDDSKQNGKFLIPAVEPGTYVLTYCTAGSDESARVCIQDTITVADEDLHLPPKDMSWSTFGIRILDVQPTQYHK